MSEDERLKEAFLDMLNQACGEWESVFPSGWTHGQPYENKFKGYDSQFLSAYADALDLAVEFGWIKKEEVLR